MTEDEAKKKWCPYASSRAVTIQLPEGKTLTSMFGGREVEKNKVRGFVPFPTCVASECMAWRWGRRSFDRDMIRDDKQGYCGLAGTP